MERKVLAELLEWKNQKSRKPIVVQGVRQCGKTYALKSFGKNYFSGCLYFNFERESYLKEIFDYDYDTDRILNELKTIRGSKDLDVSDYLIIFDEIQECPKAVTSLKYFCEERPEMYIAAAGSLLGPAIQHKNISFPVGKVTFLRMYPLSFDEFAVACGLKNEISLIGGFDCGREIPEPIADALVKLCKLYYTIGGMPEAVQKWIDTHDMDAVEKVLQDILTSYSNDFGKYLDSIEALKVGWIWDSVPVQLAKENNKFVFSHVKKGKRSAELEDALEWLCKADMIYELQKVGNPEMPLSFYADATYFKVYMCDVGLLRVKAGLSADTIMNETSLYSNFKGALTENYVMTELVKQGLSPYFWRSNNEAEVDFLIERQERVIPIEAKSELNTRAKSYLIYCKRYNPQIGLKFSMKNMGENLVADTRTFSIPLYLVWRTSDFVSIKK